MSQLQLQSSRHLQFSDDAFEALVPEDRHNDYDYRRLNLYVDRLDNLLETYNPEQVVTIDMIGTQASYQYVFYIENMMMFSSCDPYCFDDNHEKTKWLIHILSSAINFIETTYCAHFLSHAGRVEFPFSEQTKKNVTRSTEGFFKPFGDYALTKVAMESFFSQLDWWKPDSIVQIAFHKNHVENHYHLDIQLREKTSREAIIEAIDPVIVSAQEQALFSEDGEIMDKYLSQAYSHLTQALKAHPDYQHVKAKIDLFHRLDEHLKNDESDARVNIKI